jgi:hypothetical protein
MAVWVVVYNLIMMDISVTTYIQYKNCMNTSEVIHRWSNSKEKEKIENWVYI